MDALIASIGNDSLSAEVGAGSSGLIASSNGSGIVAGAKATDSAADEAAKGKLKDTWQKLLGYLRKTNPSSSPEEEIN